jgi:hypothetical protein
MSGTYAEKLSSPAHRSFFRDALSARSNRESVHEYLIDQANLRGFLGAFSDRSDLGEPDPTLEIEDIVVGLLQPHAPAEARVVKLVVRILQAQRIDAKRLLFRARRERADTTLAWIIGLVPVEEQRGAIVELQRELRARPPRDTRRPAIRYDPRRLVPRKASLP